MSFNKVWERTHKDREWGSYPNEDLVRWVFRNFGKHKDVHNKQAILDLGCGQGNNTWFLAREGFRVLAVDGSHAACEKTIKRLTDEACNVRTVVGCYGLADVEAAKTGTFDAVIDVVSSAHNSIHYLPDIYQEVSRVLKPLGRYFLITPTDKCSPEPFKGLGTITFLGETDLRLILQNWFDIVELTKSSYQPTSAYKVEHWVVSATKRG
jgi:cyclopropane fatty-acyl-phospholipid synthase-like methyltransferase